MNRNKSHIPVAGRLQNRRASDTVLAGNGMPLQKQPSMNGVNLNEEAGSLKALKEEAKNIIEKRCPSAKASLKNQIDECKASNQVLTIVGKKLLDSKNEDVQRFILAYDAIVAERTASLESVKRKLEEEKTAAKDQADAQAKEAKDLAEKLGAQATELKTVTNERNSLQETVRTLQQRNEKIDLESQRAALAADQQKQQNDKTIKDLLETKEKLEAKLADIGAQLTSQVTLNANLNQQFLLQAQNNKAQVDDLNAAIKAYETVSERNKTLDAAIKDQKAKEEEIYRSHVARLEKTIKTLEEKLGNASQNQDDAAQARFNVFQTATKKDPSQRHNGPVVASYKLGEQKAGQSTKSPKSTTSTLNETQTDLNASMLGRNRSRSMGDIMNTSAVGNISMFANDPKLAPYYDKYFKPNSPSRVAIDTLKGFISASFNPEATSLALDLLFEFTKEYTASLTDNNRKTGNIFEALLNPINIATSPGESQKKGKFAVLKEGFPAIAALCNVNNDEKKPKMSVENLTAVFKQAYKYGFIPGNDNHKAHYGIGKKKEESKQTTSSPAVTPSLKTS